MMIHLLLAISIITFSFLAHGIVRGSTDAVYAESGYSNTHLTVNSFANIVGDTL
jgi:hypothetical protein